jgi:DNA-binding HxlR family transcriptional regulator
VSQETTADYGVGSPTHLGLECLTHKWTPLIVFALKGGPLRFTEMRKAVPGLTAQVLTRSLRALERDGIVVRRYFPEVPPCVEYGLTDLGVTLCEPVGAIRAWAEKVRRGNPHRPTTLRTQQGRRLGHATTGRPAPWQATQQPQRSSDSPLNTPRSSR